MYTYIYTSVYLYIYIYNIIYIYVCVYVYTDMYVMLKPVRGARTATPSRLLLLEAFIALSSDLPEMRGGRGGSNN